MSKFKNFIEGAASINLFFQHNTIESFKESCNQAMVKIQKISQERKISEELALKNYFKERMFGQILAFILAMSFLALTVYFGINNFHIFFTVFSLIGFHFVIFGSKILNAKLQKS